MSNASRILVVDDDPDIHLLLAAALSDPNYLIQDKYDGLEALTLLETQPFDLVITDVRMPGLDGLELLRRIHELRPGTKVLVMTAESTSRTVIRSLREQALGYFSKPFSLDTVAETVALALRAPAPEDDIEVLSAIPQWIALQLHCKLASVITSNPAIRDHLKTGQWAGQDKDSYTLVCEHESRFEQEGAIDWRYPCRGYGDAGMRPER